MNPGHPFKGHSSTHSLLNIQTVNSSHYCYCFIKLNDSPAFVLQMSSDDAVKRVLAGEKVDIKTKASTSRSQDKENREGREHHLDREVRAYSPLQSWNLLRTAIYMLAFSLASCRLFFFFEKSMSHQMISFSVCSHGWHDIVTI